jgi:hypothetical protein
MMINANSKKKERGKGKKETLFTYTIELSI